MISTLRSLIGYKVFLFFFGIPLSIWGITVIVVTITTDSNLLGFINTGIIGFILVIIGVFVVFRARNNQAKILGALKTYERVTLTQLSSELKISEKQTKNAIINLRAIGKLKASFEPGTGDLLVIEVDGKPPKTFISMTSSDLEEYEEGYKDKQVPKDKNYCSYCGSIVKEEDQFCNNCGTFLHEE
ncbi:MAG: zinc ribbon domain-containing protein [Candidatus Heimdallarchaeota archaeon]|nr:zinc ribbon domain-containing protein [Candidatus Heimdallarchaeota archaeon]